VKISNRNCRVAFASALLCLLVSSFEAADADDKGVVLAEGGKAACVIVRPGSAAEPERYATEELASFLEKISGAEFEIVGESGVPGDQCGIYVGDTARGAGMIKDKELQDLGPGGFIIRTGEGNLYLRGGSPRGTLYAAYSLLEDGLGVRWYTPNATLVPEMDRVVIPSIDISEKPAFEYRESFFYHAFDGDWAARNRLNGNRYPMKPRHGGQIKYVGGFVHTFNRLVPPDEYFAEHPEYFAEIGGDRVRDSQLCLTNPDVLQIVIDKVLETAESTGGRPAIISVSQNDNMKFCSCEKCSAIDREENSHMGTMLRFVNRVAEAVADEYPNVAIDTLAYQYTENPPLLERPLPNVIIRLCHFSPCCDSHPLGKCFWNEKYVRNLEKWSKITDRLYVWDYYTNFSHYPQPHPDLDAVLRDPAFHNRQSVKGFFAQGSYQSPGGDLAELKAWVIAKLLWNPYTSGSTLIKDFLEGYYGPAAPAVMDYLTALHRRVRRQGIHVHLYSQAGCGFLDHEVLREMGEALDRAASLVEGVPEYEDRVRRLGVGMIYTKLEAPELFYEKYNPNMLDRREREELFERFENELKYFQITRIREMESLEDSMEALKHRLSE